MTDTLLPINATTQERAIEGATARLSDVPVRVREVWSPDDCPSPLLPWLASQFAVDAWDVTWTDEQKRQAIKDSIAVHKRKGTIGAVKRALAAVGFPVSVQEWFNQAPAGDPFTFWLLIDSDQVPVTQAGMSGLIALLDRTKNVRSHLTAIKVSAVTRDTISVAACANIGTEITVTNYQPGAVVANETTICM